MTDKNAARPSVGVSREAILGAEPWELQIIALSLHDRVDELQKDNAELRAEILRRCGLPHD